MDLFDRVKKGDLDYIKTVTADVLLKARDERERTVLLVATEQNQLDCCKEILKKCFSLLYIQHNSYPNYTVLHEAFCNKTNSYMFIDFFLSVGLDAATNGSSRKKNMLRFKKWIKLKSCFGHTALTYATTEGNLHIVKRLIEVDRQYNLGLAKEETVRVLGSNIKKTALQLALEYENQEMIKLLTDKGDPYSDYIPYSIAMDMFDHVKKGDLDYVKTVKQEVLLKSRDEIGSSVLHIATFENQLDCCQEILKRCPSLLYHQNNLKHTVLHQATFKGNLAYRLVNLFVGVGLDAATIEGNIESKGKNMQRFKNWINLQTWSGDTALTRAIINNCGHDTVKRLGQSERAFQLALENGDQEIIKLFSQGTDPDLEYGVNSDEKKSLLIVTTQAQEALHTGNSSDSAGRKDVTDEANTDGNKSLLISMTKSQETLHTGNNSDSAGRKDVTDKANPGSESITRLLSQLASEKPQQYSHAQLKSFMTEAPVSIGSGGFGNVYKGGFPNGVPVAIKILKTTRVDIMEKQFEAEVSTMGRTYHRNLIKLYGYCYEANTKALIYEYMENGSLDTILFKKKLDLKWEKLYTIAIEIARGISYLHESCDPQIIHHDIKPANVLLDSNLSPKVIDFGMARLNREKSQFAQTGVRGTRGYVAPEITQIELGKISYRCDVFSYGMMLFDILGSKRTKEDKGWLPGQVWEKFREKQLGNFLKDCGIKGNDKLSARILSRVALMCAEYNPKNRPSMSTVVKMLEGEIKPRKPVDPFPFYDSSSDSRTTWESRN
ncbi:hypothetical protein AQUCO_01000594v1 [Aquilegia coerulea]|uniref:non-specific serine/threonine protein kinase n=1 Tax=Aquilegia coerulea TaxID=218851 RepID=A0A2G5EAN8_AQUCA|nr:hypothetical protein AQUCO_01000594v1 [Aquilegia coerulea]